jgi:hypothetical protein
MLPEGPMLEDQINAAEVKGVQNNKYENIELDAGFADKSKLGKIRVKLEIKKIDETRNQA